VAGGVTANSLATAKRFYHSSLPPGSSPLARLAHNSIGFAAVHVQPFILAAVLPDVAWTWALTWWTLALTGAMAVARSPLYLQRAVAAAFVTAAMVGAGALNNPSGLQWFGPVLVLKLVGAHAVREEPYRPAPPPDDRHSR
jgi:hypothetical protein